MKKKSKEDFVEPVCREEELEQYWRERSEEGRNMPAAPENCERLVDLLSKDIQAALRQIRHSIDQYEEYARNRQMNALTSPIDLSILEGLRNDLAKLVDETDERFHDMLGGNDYWRWSCCNESETTEALRQEMERLARFGVESSH